MRATAGTSNCNEGAQLFWGNRLYFDQNTGASVHCPSGQVHLVGQSFHEGAKAYALDHSREFDLAPRRRLHSLAFLNR